MADVVFWLSFFTSLMIRWYVTTAWDSCLLLQYYSYWEAATRTASHLQQRNDNYSFQQRTFFLFIRLWWRRLFLDRTGYVDVDFLLLTVSKCAKNRQASSPSFLPLTFRRLHPTGYTALVSSSAYSAGMFRHRGVPKTRSWPFYFW